MNKNKTPIGLEERKKIQLEMLKKIDAFCKANNIKYSLAFGTLLGAIRHKGFIPWDDDVDIMMPLPDMLRFKELFHSETMKYCDIDTDRYFEYPFSRIANTQTYDRRGLIAKSYGICIDLYPIVSIPKDSRERNVFFQKAQKLVNVRLCYLRWNGVAVRYIPIKALPGFRKTMKRYRDYILNLKEYGKTGAYYIVAGPLRLKDKMSYDTDLFEKIIEVDFENYKFLSISDYDTYLSLRYGDYMQLPPEEDRHPYHGGNYYWK